MVDLESTHVGSWIFCEPICGGGSWEDLAVHTDPVRTLWPPRILRGPFLVPDPESALLDPERRPRPLKLTREAA